MSSPVSGPYSEYFSTNTVGRYRWWYRGARTDAGELVLAPHPHKACKALRKGAYVLSYNLLGNAGACYHYASASSINTAYSACYTRFARDVWRDAQTALAVDLAERKQTLGLLTGTFGKLFKAVRQVRRGQFASAMKTLTGKRPPKKSGFHLLRMEKGATDEVFLQNWMAIRYGWMPLLNSIHDLVSVLEKPIQDAPVHSSAKSETHTTTYASKGPQKGKPIYRNDWWHRCRMQGKVAISDPLLASLNQYGLVNPLAVAWELVPLSFVVDWFLPVGKIIEDQTRFVGLTFSEGIISYTTHAEDWFKRNDNGQPPDECIVYSFLKERKLWSGSAPPVPNRWQVDTSISATHAMDALALLTGALRKRAT